jgi:hypothetical protein
VSRPGGRRTRVLDDAVLRDQVGQELRVVQPERVVVRLFADPVGIMV